MKHGQRVPIPTAKNTRASSITTKRGEGEFYKGMKRGQGTRTYRDGEQGKYREGKGREGARVCMLASIMLVHADAFLRSNS